MTRLPARTVYYGLEFFLRFPTWVVMAVYLVRELHFTPLQLVLMGTVMEASVFLFEIPTGVVADTYSRRLSLIIGYLGIGASWTLVAIVSEPWVVIALWALWGISYTFTSGAYQAWITDEVGRENLGSLFLRGKRLGYVGAVVGLAVQVALGVWSLRAGIIVGGAVTIGCGLACIFLMPETGFRAAAAIRARICLQRAAQDGVGRRRYAWAAPIVLLLIVAELFMGMSSEAFDRLKEAHFLRDVGLPAIGHLDPVVWFGIFSLAGMAIGFAAMGPMIKWVERGGQRVVARALFGFTLLEMAAMLVFALSGSVWLAIAALLGIFFARDFAWPLYDTWLNMQITNSSVRATVMSISGQANAIGQAGGGPVLGVIGNVWGIRAALAAGAVVIAPVLALYGRAIAHHGREPELDELPAPEAV